MRGDASGEWALDENGKVDDIVFFASPRSMGYGQKIEVDAPSVAGCSGAEL